VTGEADQSVTAASESGCQERQGSGPSPLILKANGRQRANPGRGEGILVEVAELQRRRAEREAERVRLVPFIGSILNDPDVGRESDGR